MAVGKRLIKSNNAASAGGVDVSSLTYNALKSYTGNGVETGPYHHGYFYLSDSGSKLYIAYTNYDNHNDTQYSLSTPYDFSTISGQVQSVNRNYNNNYNTSMFWKSDGTKYFMTGYTNSYGSGSNTIIMATMSTPWNLSTASIHQSDRPGSFIGHHANSISFLESGNTWYSVSNVNASNSLVDNTILRQYSLFNSWDFSSGNAIANTVDLKTIVPEWVSGNYYDGSNGWADGHFIVHPNGESAYILIPRYASGNYQESKIHKFTMSTAGDITTLSADSSVIIPGSVFSNAGAPGAHGNMQVLENGSIVITARYGGFPNWRYGFFVFD